MALTKSDRDWVQGTVKDVIERVIPQCMPKQCIPLARVETTLWGAEKNDGLVETVRSHGNIIDELKTSVTKMAEQVDTIKRTAVFWARTVGVTALGAIGTIVTYLLLYGQHKP